MKRRRRIGWSRIRGKGRIHWANDERSQTMPLNQPTTEIVGIDEVRDRLDDLLKHAVGRDRRVVIEREGRPVAALISFADLEWLDMLREQRVERLKFLDEIGRGFDEVSDEELEREIDRAVAEVRAKMRVEREQVASLHR